MPCKDPDNRLLLLFEKGKEYVHLIIEVLFIMTNFKPGSASSVDISKEELYVVHSIISEMTTEEATI